MTRIIPKFVKQFYVSAINKIVSYVVPADLNDVLLIRLDELGDFVLWLDTAKEYRKLYYPKHLTLLVNKKWYDLAKTLPYWDEVIGLDTTRFKIDPFYRLQMLFFIRKQGFEIVICPRWSVKFTLEPAIVAMSGAREKIVYQGTFPYLKMNWYTKMVPCRCEPLHELENNANFIRGLGLKDFKASVPKLNLSYVKIPLKFVVVCPTSYRKRKEWPLAAYCELMSKMYQSAQIKTILISDRRINCVFPDYVRNLTGKTSLPAFMQYILSSQLVIANDSAPIHLAVALGVPSICIGSENYERFVPYPPDLEGVLPKLVYCKDVKQIPVDVVWEVVKGLL